MIALALLFINKQLQFWVLGAAATDVLRKGLEDLNSICEHVLTTFKVSLFQFLDKNYADETG